VNQDTTRGGLCGSGRRSFRSSRPEQPVCQSGRKAGSVEARPQRRSEVEGHVRRTKKASHIEAPMVRPLHMQVWFLLGIGGVEEEGACMSTERFSR